MTIRTRLLASALSLALAPVVGCIGASDDKLGSGYHAGTGGEAINGGEGIKTSTQQTRNDKGDAPRIGDANGTVRPNDANATRTGGLGGTRPDTPAGPGATGPRTSDGVASGPK